MSAAPAAQGPEPARAADLAEVRALLEKARLPSADLTGAHLAHFVVLRDRGRIVGVAGLEVHGADGLLRSVAVDSGRRSQGLGEVLVGAVERHALALGVADLYLLTNTAADYFARRGWQFTERDGVPAGIRATAEFAALCPSDAQCLTKKIKGVSL